MTREFYLPELPRLLPVAYHPKAAQIEFASNGWVRRMMGGCFGSEAELLRYLRERNGLYGPMVAPFATEQRARDVADWYQYVTVIDTLASDRSQLGRSESNARAVFAGIVASFNGDPEMVRDSPYAHATKDLWRRFDPGLSEGQRRRFATSLEGQLRGSAIEIRAKLTNQVPDFETCLTVRVDSFGCGFIELLTEYAAAIDLTELLPELVEVHRHSRTQMILVNDLLSWRKEHAQDDRMSTVRVLTERDGRHLQDAVNLLCTLVEDHERAYLAARDAVLAGPHGGRLDLRAYLRGLDHVIGGSQEFEYLTPRYFGDGSVWDGTTSGWINLDDPVTRFTAYPAPRRMDEPEPMGGRGWRAYSCRQR